MIDLAFAPFASVVAGDTRVALLKDGLQAFPSMLEAIASATRTICFETYILRDDATGRRFAAALELKARAGVEVNLIFDGWGSSVSDEYLAQLRDAGVRVLIFQPFRFSPRLGRLLAKTRPRNHRKTLIVDGVVGFTGGLNISDDYASEADGGRGWRDTHVRLEGPPVGEMQRLFLGTWRQYKGARLDESRYPSSRAASSTVRILGNHFRRDRKDIRKAYIAAISKAQRCVYITNSYFLPPARMLKELMRAARHRVRVAVILAASTDVGIVLWAARGLYPRLLKSGVEVYEWEGAILHAKTAVVDGQWSTVGSANLDALSLRINLEVNAVFEDPGVAQAVERLFEEDLTHCTRVTLEELGQRTLIERFLSWFAWQLRHWL